MYLNFLSKASEFAGYTKSILKMTKQKAVFTKNAYKYGEIVQYDEFDCPKNFIFIIDKKGGYRYNIFYPLDSEVSIIVYLVIHKK